MYLQKKRIFCKIQAKSLISSGYIVRCSWESRLMGCHAASVMAGWIAKTELQIRAASHQTPPAKAAS